MILGIAVQETEGRRLVLRGRRTITRHYYSKLKPLIIYQQNLKKKLFRFFFASIKLGGTIIPAWLIVVLIGLAEIVFGVALFFALSRMILTKSHDDLMNTYQPALLEDNGRVD